MFLLGQLLRMLGLLLSLKSCTQREDREFAAGLQVVYCLGIKDEGKEREETKRSKGNRGV